MARRVAFQADLLSRLNPATDSTLRLAAEALRRGDAVFFYTPHDLSWSQQGLQALAHPVRHIDLAAGQHEVGAPITLNLATLDVVWVRQDPPFDMAYVASLQLLELLPPAVRVLNNPRAIRDNPEKLLVLRFPKFTPPTLISRDKAAIVAFRAAQGDIVLKPLFGHASHGVFHITPEDGNFSSALELLLARNHEPLIVQKYVPEVRAGDRRILLVAGQPVGVFARVPAVGEARAALRTGATAMKATLTARERDICAALAPVLQAQDLLFVGIDVLGDWLTEINVTSPTGIAQLNALDGVCTEALVWDALEV